MAQRFFGIPPGGQHECEILGSGQEAEEGGTRWKACKKNPGHEKFISVQDFSDFYLSKLDTASQRDRLKAVIDLTVRLRVNCTSVDRPDGSPFSGARGSDILRLGTGFIQDVKGPLSIKHCPCAECNGKVLRKFWIFMVYTAHHVVYNTEEAKATKVDMFYDCDSCLRDGRMKSTLGFEVIKTVPENDVCHMLCVTHDEALGERLKSAELSWGSGGYTLNLSGLDLLPPCERRVFLTLVVSHPHGQAKRITLGEGRESESPHVEYNAATCPGSSGAPVFECTTDLGDGRILLWLPPVHSGCLPAASAQPQGQTDQRNLLSRSPQERETKLEQRNYANIW
ncbi:hypothetical protein EGW08_002043 [Elysia chlorotica]|uniref:Peptidase S1 domain-containing protein n=1 Tax=Elysia chlorotica TaxID=188477 RepID=A0A3S1BS26_ELYCH|nr:hypothetical protein EGW08_002043 [Elysia chlorotica]